MESPNRTRTQSLLIRLREDERAELDALADADRTSISDVVRRLVRAAHQKQFGAAKPKKAKS